MKRQCQFFLLIFCIVLSMLNFVPITANADYVSDLTSEAVFQYTGSMQTYTVPETGMYTVELFGGAGGDAPGLDLDEALADPSWPSHIKHFFGGRGGHVKFTKQFNKGDVLYLYVGSIGNVNIAKPNGTTSRGGSAFNSRGSSGGGASEIRLNSNSRSALLAVAGGGGGAVRNSVTTGQHGSDAATKYSGNNGDSSGKGSDAKSYGAGGGGGYYGGANGSSTHSANGGSNYVSNNVNVEINDINPNKQTGHISIKKLSSYVCVINPNGGYYDNTNKNSVYTLDNTYYTSKTFNSVGNQAYTIPYSGYYYTELYGAQGGNDGGAIGGNGGYTKSIHYFSQGQRIYVSIGGRGESNAYSDYLYNHREHWSGGFNNGGSASIYPDWEDDDDDYSGGGGGATFIATTFPSGTSGQLSDYANLKGSILAVAGGGGGAAAGQSGSGGSVLYAGNQSRSVVIKGGTGMLRNTSSVLQYNWSGFAWGATPVGYPEAGDNEDAWQDGSGGGGGWVGGKAGHDGHYGAGGGASYINTDNKNICIDLVAGANAGNGLARITYMQDIIVLDTPTREGYTFVNWSCSGPGYIEYNSLSGKYIFHYKAGTTTLTANWKRLDGYGDLAVNPNGGFYNNSNENAHYTKPNGTRLNIPASDKYGYIFNGYSFTGGGTWNNPTYSFITNQAGYLTANYNLAKTTLTVDPNTGVYNNTTNKTIYNNKPYGTVQKIDDPTKIGYTFDWWDEINGSDGFLTTDGWHFGTTNGYLKAHWTPNTYYVIYKNYDGKGNDYTQTCIYDQNYNYLNNPNDLSDSIFVGWFNKENPNNLTDGKIAGGIAFTNLTPEPYGKIYVYGKWSKTNLKTEDGNNAFIKTDQIQINGSNIYKSPYENKKYFVKGDVPFSLSFNGIIDSNINMPFLPMITNINKFCISSTSTSIDNNDYIFNTNLNVTPLNNISVLTYKNNYTAIRKNNSTFNTNKTSLNYLQTYVFAANKDSQTVEVIPHTATRLTRSNINGNYTTTYNSIASDDKTHNILLECDGIEPTIINDSIIDEKYIPSSPDYYPLISEKETIVFKYADYIKNVDPTNPTYGSGVKAGNIKLFVTQEQTDDGKGPKTQIYTGSSINDYIKITTLSDYTGEIKIEINPSKYSDMSGFITFKLEITDNVGNVATKEIRILVLDLQAKIKNISPNTNSDSTVFAQGENGQIIIETNGFADKLNISFPTYLDNLAANEKVSGNESIWEIGRTLSDTYPRDKDGNITTVLPDLQTKLWGTTHLGGMEWTGTKYEHSFLTHYFYAPLYSDSGKYQVAVTVYKTDPKDSTKTYTIEKVLNFNIGQDVDGSTIPPITEEFRDEIQDN